MSLDDDRYGRVLLGSSSTDLESLRSDLLNPWRLTLITPLHNPNPSLRRLGLKAINFTSVFISTETAADNADEMILATHPHRPNLTPPTPLEASRPIPPPPNFFAPPPPPPPLPPNFPTSPSTNIRPTHFPTPVLLNTHSQRLDAPLPPLGSAGWAYINKIQTDPSSKVCNDHHLLGNCRQGSSCQYSHAPVEDDVLLAMVRGMRGISCVKGSKCRNGMCMFGHVCPYPRCGERGKQCRFSREAHEVQEVGVRVWDGRA